MPGREEKLQWFVAGMLMMPGSCRYRYRPLISEEMNSTFESLSAALLRPGSAALWSLWALHASCVEMAHGAQITPPSTAPASLWFLFVSGQIHGVVLLLNPSFC